MQIFLRNVSKGLVNDEVLQITTGFNSKGDRKLI
jgi:hypothetical protein